MRDNNPNAEYFNYNDLSIQIKKYKVLRSFIYPVMRQVFFSSTSFKDDKDLYMESFDSFYETIIKPSFKSIIYFDDGKIDYATLNKMLLKENDYSHICALVKENDKYIVYDFKETFHRYLKDILTEKQFNNLIVTNSFK
ncbi:hypothetical protein [Staphylococcus phage vB_StaM_PB50]|nr:hypothetical protein [Staphylococcus phage vB_StaM_PB50]